MYDAVPQVNGKRLLGLNHMEVVNILKELPVHVRMVCARRSGHPPLHAFDVSGHEPDQFAARVRRFIYHHRELEGMCYR